MSNTALDWDISHLRKHLQWAADLELWTIPYYLTVLHSIKDRSSLTYQLVQSVAYQEMLHVQSTANIANAFGAKLQFSFKNYKGGPFNGSTLPHLNFKLDTPNPTEWFIPHSVELGPLDLARINSMCLVEYPIWKTGHRPNAREDISKYGSVGNTVRLNDVDTPQNGKPGVFSSRHFGHKHGRFAMGLLTALSWAHESGVRRTPGLDNSGA